MKIIITLDCDAQDKDLSEIKKCIWEEFDSMQGSFMNIPTTLAYIHSVKVNSEEIEKETEKIRRKKAIEIVSEFGSKMRNLLGS